MTTILPPSDLILYRGLAKTAAVLLVCLRIDALYPGRAIADFEIADILEQDRRTINRHLRSLSASGLMLEQRENRYVLTPMGRNTLFANRQTTYFSIEEPKITSEEPSPRAQNVPHDMNDDDSISLIDSDSSSINERTKCARYLAATDLLFGSPVSDKGITDRDPIHALAWIAKAYNDRHNLSNPQGLVFRRLQSNERPPVWMLKDPIKGLPDEYLIAVGLMDETASSSDMETAPPVCEDDPIPDDVREAWDRMAEHLRKSDEKSQIKTCVVGLFQPAKFIDESLYLNVVIKKHLDNESMRAEIQKLLRQQGCVIDVKFFIRGDL